jgi:hypothetical protein
MHPISLGSNPKPPAATRGPSWLGWDIARGVAIDSDGTGGLVLDGFGGLHRFGVGNGALPARETSGPYWLGWDIARGVAL